MKLNVGAGTTRLPTGAGWLNVDFLPSPGLDCVFNLQQPWPFADGSLEFVHGSHVLEHLHDPVTFFQEAWRVLRGDGECVLRVPYGGHRAAWWDLTHVRPWFPESFAFLQPGYAASVGNPQHTDTIHPWHVVVVQSRVSSLWARRLRWRWRRRVLLPWVMDAASAIEELFVTLRPIKDAQGLADWQAAHRHPVVVPVGIVAYDHDVRGEPARAGVPLTLVRMGVGETSAAYAVGGT